MDGIRIRDFRAKHSFADARLRMLVGGIYATILSCGERGGYLRERIAFEIERFLQGVSRAA